MAGSRRAPVTLLLAAALWAWAPRVAAQPAPPSAAPGRAQLSDEAEFLRAVSLYDAGKYEDCVSTFSGLLDPSSERTLRDSAIIERARVYYAACLIGAGQPEAADAPLRDAIAANPQMRSPDPIVFPQAVIDRFVRVRDGMIEQIRRAEAERLRRAQAAQAAERERRQRELSRQRRLELLASQETVIVPRSRALAAIPFGVGQFQNGDHILGWTLLTTELLLTGVVVGGIAVELHNYGKLDQPNLVFADIGDNAQLARDIWTAGLYGLVGVAALGVLEAQLSFEPEVRYVRPRPLPPELRSPESARALQVWPTWGLSGPFSAGLVGRF